MNDHLRQKMFAFTQCEHIIKVHSHLIVIVIQCEH